MCMRVCERCVASCAHRLTLSCCWRVLVAYVCTYVCVGCIVSGSSDSEVWVWHARTGMALRHFVAHSGLVRGVALDAERDRLVTGSYDGTIAVWRFSSGTPTAEKGTCVCLCVRACVCVCLCL
jgi:WD40 repeat protein